MARIFVSYSRKNIDFARRLTRALQTRDIDFWVDWDGIPPTADWKQQIQKGIEEADIFLFIISPDSIKSKVCKEELAIAAKNGKRLIPIVANEVVWEEAPSEISHLNYIFFREADDFDAAFMKLLTAIDTDYGWVQTQRRLQVKALEWERGDKDNGFLLHGKDLEDAEQQISVNANKSPQPTDIQREYILKSRQATDRQRRITTGVLVFITLIMVGITAVLAIPRILDKIAQERARGKMIPIPEGPSIFGVENPLLVEFDFPPRQSIPSLPAFQIGKHEVSNYQYGLCVKYGDCTVPVVPTNFDDETIRNLPVVNVTLFQANTYCQWLGQRLPNQFEWERAARGPDMYRWPWGNDKEPTPETANMLWKEYQPSGLKPVDSNQAGESPEGIYNLVGNATEWTSSILPEGSIIYDPTQVWNGDPETYDGTLTYAKRGGSWRDYVDELAVYIADRGISARDDLGFRCAADAP